MARRYSAKKNSSLISETNGFCHLPENVIVRDFPSNAGYKGKMVNDMYNLVEEQTKADRSDLERLTNPTKI